MKKKLIMLGVAAALSLTFEAAAMDNLKSPRMPEGGPRDEAPVSSGNRTPSDNFNCLYDGGVGLATYSSQRNCENMGGYWFGPSGSFWGRAIDWWSRF